MKPRRKYAAYHRILGKRKWRRKHPDICGSKAQIARIYQGWLISGEPGITNVERCIRPIPRPRKKN